MERVYFFSLDFPAEGRFARKQEVLCYKKAGDDLVDLSDVELSKNLSDLMSEKRLSLQIVATRSGINKSTLHNYLNGVLPQGLLVLLKLCHFFDISLEEIIFSRKRSSNNHPSPTTNMAVEEKFEITIKRVNHR